MAEAAEAAAVLFKKSLLENAISSPFVLEYYKGSIALSKILYHDLCQEINLFSDR
jgi:hypothetical protein